MLAGRIGSIRAPLRPALATNSRSASTMLPSVLPTKLGKSTVDSSIEVDGVENKAHWLRLKVLSWTDQEGRKRKWEMAERKTTSKSGVDAVAIVSVLSHPSKPLSIPIILQYRPPVQAICVELPAGLIDADETAETAAVRELQEETGYGGELYEGRIKVVHVGETVVSDPGMSKANMKLVTLEVQLKEDEELPVANLEDGEHIEVRITPLKELYAHLQAYNALGYIVDARLYHFAAGIAAAQNYRL